MQITDSLKKLAALRDYAAATHSEPLEKSETTDRLGSKLPWKIVLRYDGKVRSFELDGGEQAGIKGEFELVRQIPELFSN